MPPCIECTRLWNEYTNLRLKYRLSVSARENFGDGDPDKKRDASELARRIFEEHEMTHRPQPKTVPAPRPAETPAHAAGVILLPAAASSGR